ncbi:MAG TPA: Na+/H+ antiporter [Acidobacteriaceae bacterium]
MSGHGIHATELLLMALVALISFLSAVAQRLTVPYPIVLVIGGLVLSLLPVFPDIQLNPTFIFLVVLPPLLYATALQTSWREFRNNIVTILLLAFGLVAFTVAGVAVGAHLFLPGFDLATGALLGAVVSTTDAISASAIGRRVGLPRELLDIIEGESMVNDAAGLLALQFCVSIVASGSTPSLAAGAGELLLLVLGGVAAGLLVGKLVSMLQRPVRGSATQTLLSLGTPYLAYLLAESMHASGVLATICCGLYVGRQSSEAFTSQGRLEGQAVWNTIEFALNGFVFILIGLQLPAVLNLMRPLDWLHLLAGSAFISLLLLLLRMAWIYPVAHLARFVRRRMLRQREAMEVNNRRAFVVGWAGMRGVLTLAAALSLPETNDAGQPFAHRAAIIFLAFASILVSLTAQGLSLPWIIRRLGVCASPGMLEEERRARRRLITAALRMLEQLRQDSAEEAEVTTDLIERYYRQRLDALQEVKGRSAPQQMRVYAEITGKLRSTERAELLKLQNQGQIGGETLRKLERELDLLDLRWPTS